jgi:hypothetical protein
VEGADLIGAHSLTTFAQYVYDHEKLPVTTSCQH